MRFTIVSLFQLPIISNKPRIIYRSSLQRYLVSISHRSLLTIVYCWNIVSTFICYTNARQLYVYNLCAANAQQIYHLSLKRSLLTRYTRENAPLSNNRISPSRCSYVLWIFKYRNIWYTVIHRIYKLSNKKYEIVSLWNLESYPQLTTVHFHLLTHSMEHLVEHNKSF